VSSGSSEVEETGQEAEVGLQEVREEEIPIIEEVTDEADTVNDTGVEGSDEAAEPAPKQEEILQEEKAQEPEINLPENIQELVKFMEETGGTIDDYARLNADYSNVDDDTLLVEYYKQTKPHLSYEEIQFLMEDKFSVDEDLDDERNVRRKKLALKEEVANAKNFLTGLKDKYYKEVKLGSKLLPEQQKAIEFFSRYNEEQKSASELLAKQTSHFKNETDKVFHNEFKGFNFNVGDKKYRFNIKDVNKAKENSNLSNVFDKYVDKNQMMVNAKDFHKSLFAASNPDALAKHFYEQGKSDAIKEMSANAKNINMDPRKTSDGYVDTGGVKVKAISGDNSSGLKLKLKNY
jgi:vacuolar-type H+-ATPase subunit H